MQNNRLKPELDPCALARELSGKLLIGGALVPARRGGTFPNVNPATGAVIGRAAEGDARERGKLIVECGRVLNEHVEELGRLVALETGKALRTESRIEASILADVFTFFGGLGSELKGETVPFRPDMLTLTVREPLGVIGAIIPWNVPMMLMALKIR
jgi:aldehyde dehydrogenase (NAD+)